MELGCPPRGKALSTVTEKLPASCVPSARLPLGLDGEGEKASLLLPGAAKQLRSHHPGLLPQNKEKKNYNSQQRRCTHAQVETAPLACHLLVRLKDHMHLRTLLLPFTIAGMELQLPECSAATHRKKHFPEGCCGVAYGLGSWHLSAGTARPVAVHGFPRGLFWRLRRQDCGPAE